MRQTARQEARFLARLQKGKAALRVRHVAFVNKTRIAGILPFEIREVLWSELARATTLVDDRHDSADHMPLSAKPGSC